MEKPTFVIVDGKLRWIYPMSWRIFNIVLLAGFGFSFGYLFFGRDLTLGYLTGLGGMLGGAAIFVIEALRYHRWQR